MNATLLPCVVDGSAIATVSLPLSGIVAPYSVCLPDSQVLWYRAPLFHAPHGPYCVPNGFVGDNHERRCFSESVESPTLFATSTSIRPESYCFPDPDSQVCGGDLASMWGTGRCTTKRGLVHVRKRRETKPAGRLRGTGIDDISVQRGRSRRIWMSPLSVDLPDVVYGRHALNVTSFLRPWTFTYFATSMARLEDILLSHASADPLLARKVSTQRRRRLVLQRNEHPHPPIPRVIIRPGRR